MHSILYGLCSALPFDVRDVLADPFPLSWPVGHEPVHQHEVANALVDGPMAALADGHEVVQLKLEGWIQSPVEDVVDG